jgi:hypothetical protein
MNKGRVVRGALWMVVGACAVALAFGVTVRLLGGVTEATCRRLQPGMHLRDVEALFGGPAQEEGAGVEGRMRTWRGEKGDAVVLFWRDRVVLLCPS